MAVLLGTLALAVALTAVWFTVEALRRGEGRTEAAVQPDVGALKRAVADEARMLQAVSVRLDAIERDVRLLKLEGIEVDDVEPHILATRQAVDQARRFYPSAALQG